MYNHKKQRERNGIHDPKSTQKKREKETHENGGLYKLVSLMVCPRNQQKKRKKRIL